MRIWSIHPKYLDSKGLVALWRESLLAKQVLEGKSIAYRNHPQLLRFRFSSNPVDAINQYLSEVYKEAHERHYSFDKSKIDWHFKPQSLTIKCGQLAFETSHLLQKLEQRSPERFYDLREFNGFDAHPLFTMVDGSIESWEKL
jgi:hypothetical protein